LDAFCVQPFFVHASLNACHSTLHKYALETISAGKRSVVSTRRFHIMATPVPHHGNDRALPFYNPKQASRHQTHHTAQIRPQNHFWRETLRRFHTPVPHHGNDGALPSNNPKQASRYKSITLHKYALETISAGKRSVVSTRRFHTMATTERCPPTIRSKLRGIKPITNELIACPSEIS
jgi:hypothetical protein